MTQENKYSQHLEMNRNFPVDFSNIQEESEIKEASSKNMRGLSLA